VALSGDTLSSTFVDVLRERARLQPDERLFTFVADDEDVEVHVSYRELDQAARLVAMELQRYLRPGDRALLLHPPGRDYVEAFFGCLYAGVIAVPAYPPDPARLGRTLPRLQALVASCQASVVLTTSVIREMAELLTQDAPDLRALRWVATDARSGNSGQGWAPPPLSPDSVAFLQYTSGSTGTPRGVVLSHRNLLHNSALITEGFGLSPREPLVSWLPPYHDMGLIGCILQPLFRDLPTVLLSPRAFLQRPLRWLEILSRYGGAVSGGPNFAFELCVRKTTPAQRAALDLSRWRVAFCGAEPIRAQTVERFTEAFAPAGFRPEAFFPCYGLAEGTLFVSGGPAGRLPVKRHFDTQALRRGELREIEGAGGMALVGCGRPAREQELLVVDPETREPCAPGRVGEIWVSGASVAQGYWQQPEDSARVFEARLADSERGPFLRTGDLGVLQGEQLFITGRRKDLIILRGRNHYPQDIEVTVERCSPRLRPGCGAAFSVEVEGAEQLVVVHELAAREDEESPAEVCARVRQAVAEQHELALHAVVLLAPGSIPKTSSGKIQRHACRAAFLEGSLEEVHAWRESQEAGGESPHGAAGSEASTVEPADVGTWLALQVARALRVEVRELHPEQPLTRYGLDSLRALELQHQIEATYARALPSAFLLRGPSLRELEAMLRQSQVAAIPGSRATLAMEGEASGPLSDGQRALWFLQRMNPASTAYHIARKVRLPASLDVPALGRAFQALLSRHPMLRAVFPEEHGEPRLQILAAAGPVLGVEDASAWSEETLRERLEDEAHRPFELERGPLMRATLYSRGSGEHVLLLVLHHLITDFWSLAVMVRELGILYEAEQRGTSVTLPPLPLRYVDHVRAQAEQLADPRGEALSAYWGKKLAGAPQALELPTSLPRPRLQSFRGASLMFRVGTGTAERLRALAREHDATLYMVLLAGFFAFLRRYSGQEELVVGSPTAGRPRAELAGLVGYFVNPVPLRASIPAGTSFGELVVQVRRTVLEALEHQELPFTRLVEQLRLRRDPARSPVFQTMFVLQRSQLPDDALAAFALGEPGARLRMGGLELESLTLGQRSTPFELTLAMAEVDGGLTASLEYCVDLFDAATAQRMARHFQALLEGWGAAPSLPLEAVPLLSAEERADVLRWGHGGEALHPDRRCVQALFEEVASREPARVALSSERGQWTYGELNTWANQLARLLKRHGVGPEVFVGVLLPRGVEAVVAFWAILKAGGVYVPVELGQPRERMAWLLADAGVRVVVTRGGLFDPAAAPHEARVVRMEEEPWRAEDGTNLPHLGQGEHAAYVIYTSGSTGRPKGVVVTHAGAARMAHAMARRFRVERDSRVLQVCSLGFDISISDMLSTQTVGARLEVVESRELLAGEGLHRVLKERGITGVTIPPSVLALVPPEGLEALQTVVSGGEECPADLVGRWAPGRVFINAYGPTEITVCATCGEVAPDGHKPPIGQPLPGVRTYVLDEAMGLVPPGVPGELYIGGVGVARGYLGLPGLTAERFVPDPFSTEPGARLYRSGDLARWLPEGRLEFLGRADAQVKLRGFRIEPGEIEVVLREWAGARQAHVLLWRPPDAEPRLVAYVVPGSEPWLTPRELRARLRERLPEHLIPADFVLLEALPLTANGKVDRRALPSPLEAPMARQAASAPPRGPMEEAIARTWAKVLGLAAVGVHEHFFEELGGNSLAAVKASALLREELKQEVPVTHFFEHPTIHALAQRLSQAGARDVPSPQPRERADARRQALKQRGGRGPRGNE
jgi:amino acid adenylation domain-containing protein